MSITSRSKMAVLTVLGFSSGLPFYLSGKTLQAWMTQAGVDLTTVGLFSLVALPYSLKFLWAPLFDRYVPPFLGRRRGWIVLAQIILMLVIAVMATHNPQLGLQMLGVNALALAFMSATQDIVAEAYRADVLEEREMGNGAAVWVLGYRIALLITGSAMFILADRLSWPIAYVAVSVLMIPGILAAVLGPEPAVTAPPPTSLAEAVYGPFKEFFTRSGLGMGLLILFFIVMYKYADSLAGNMSTPFLIKVGFTLSEIGVILGGVGMVATIVGALLGGVAVSKIGINRSLWIFLFVQAFTNFAYYVIAVNGKSNSLLLAAIVIENIGQGLVTAALVAYMMSLCNARFSATQFALLSSLMAASRDILVAPAGRIAELVGWPMFFIITILAAIPAFVLLPIVAPWRRTDAL